MPPPTLDARALAQSGLSQLRQGDAEAARKTFGQIIAADIADASVYLGLAYACRSLNDDIAMVAALDSTLAIEPQNLRALLMKADHLSAAGDERAALSFYQAAVKVAATTAQLPADLQQQVVHAQERCEQSVATLESSIRNRLAEQGLVPEESGEQLQPSIRRFEQSLDILLGKKKAYFQEPRYYFFPSLPQIQFYDRQNFPWLDKVEAATAEIRAELIEVMRGDSAGSPAFKPYVQGDARRPYNPQNGMLNNPDWSAFYLWKNGEIVHENAARCPRTMAALADVPIAQVANRSPSILFSLLRPGAHIPPHNGLVNTRLICHLPLIVPEKCTFRVGNETHPWVEGKAWIFDDTIEHEAWNESDQTRVILLFEIWQPDLTAKERQQVKTMYEAIDEQSGVKPKWEI